MPLPHSARSRGRNACLYRRHYSEPEEEFLQGTCKCTRPLADSEALTFRVYDSSENPSSSESALEVGVACWRSFRRFTTPSTGWCVQARNARACWCLRVFWRCCSWPCCSRGIVDTWTTSTIVCVVYTACLRRPKSPGRTSICSIPRNISIDSSESAGSKPVVPSGGTP